MAHGVLLHFLYNRAGQLLYARPDLPKVNLWVFLKQNFIHTGLITSVKELRGRSL